MHNGTQLLYGEYFGVKIIEIPVTIIHILYFESAYCILYNFYLAISLCILCNCILSIFNSYTMATRDLPDIYA